MGVYSHATLVLTNQADQILKQNEEVRDLLSSSFDTSKEGDQILYCFKSLKVYQDVKGNEFHTIMSLLSPSDYLLSKVILDTEYGYDLDEYGELESNWETEVDVTVDLTY